jgi:hypothetical protein
MEEEVKVDVRRPHIWNQKFQRMGILKEGFASSDLGTAVNNWIAYVTTYRGYLMY